MSRPLGEKLFETSLAAWKKRHKKEVEEFIVRVNCACGAAALAAAIHVDISSGHLALSAFAQAALLTLLQEEYRTKRIRVASCDGGYRFSWAEIDDGVLAPIENDSDSDDMPDLQSDSEEEEEDDVTAALKQHWGTEMHRAYRRRLYDLGAENPYRFYVKRGPFYP
jgi:hypothetical protein